MALQGHSRRPAGTARCPTTPWQVLPVQLPVRPSRDAGDPGFSALSQGKSEGRGLPLRPMAPGRVLHQQDPFEGLQGSPRSPPLLAPNAPAPFWVLCPVQPRAWGCWEPRAPWYSILSRFPIRGTPAPWLFVNISIRSNSPWNWLTPLAAAQ